MTTTTLAGNDLTIGTDGNLALATGLGAVLADAERAVRVIRGELVFAIDEGVPYFEVVWNGTPNVAQFEAAVRSRLLALAEVLEVVTLAARQVGGVLRYEAQIRTIYGTGTVNGGL